MNEEIDVVIKNTKEIAEVSMAISDLNWCKPHFGLFNVIAEFSERNSNLINTMITQVLNNFDGSYLNKEKMFFIDDFIDNRITLFFVMRDVIENIEIIFYLLLNNSKLINNDLTINETYLNKLEKLRGKQKMKKLPISNTLSDSLLEKELLKKYGKKILPEEFKKIYNIKNECNNYIHKNGIKYINAKEKSYHIFMIDYLKDLLFVFKFNFKLLFLLEGHILASCDYVDYLDMGMTPPENSQYWIAPIFSDYIQNQFNKSEIDWLKENNYYGMKIHELI